jgi:hypothetical protein
MLSSTATVSLLRQRQDAKFSQHGFLSLHPVTAGGPTHMGDLPMLLLMRSMQHSTVPCEACGAGRRRKRAMLDRSTAAACGFRPDELCWPPLDCCADAVPAQESSSHRWHLGLCAGMLHGMLYRAWVVNARKPLQH